MAEKLIYLGSFGEKIKDTGDKLIKKAEMFSTGVHRGVEYTDEDLEQLVDSFSSEQEIPVQIDHSESARDTVGYIREAYSENGKLNGELEIIDENAKERIEKGLMKKLSVSFYLKHTEEGFKPNKLREVSLVAFPQVKGAQLFSENGYVSDYKDEGGNSMADENKQKFTQEEVDNKVNQAQEDLVNKYEALEEKLDKLVSANEKYSEQEVTNRVERFQEDKKIIPAQADSLKKLMNSFSEEQSKLFDEFMKNNKAVDFTEKGEFTEDEHDDDKDDERSKEQKEFDNFYEEYTKKYGKEL